MRKFSAGLISIKLVLIFLAGAVFFSSCESFSVNSQTKPKGSPEAETQNNMDKDLKNLEDFKWENRIILVKENDAEALKQLRESVAAINDRDIIWFRLSDGKIETNYRGKLPQDFGEQLEKEYFGKFKSNVLLIGKDGGVKSEDEKFDLKKYFELIDSMPMRRQEMKQN